MATRVCKSRADTLMGEGRSCFLWDNIHGSYKVNFVFLIEHAVLHANFVFTLGLQRICNIDTCMPI
uniref:Uncharacterized protein n=1 Tax=Rhizophora mucronata TaxID=61149 RepID=A0A2P2NL34_RHIMU